MPSRFAALMPKPTGLYAIILIVSFAPHCCLSNMRILIFGGNGFMGAETTKQLLAANHNVTLLNRGHWSWDTLDTIQPYVKHIYCDRRDPESCMEDLVGIEEKFDALIDFSAYRVGDVKPFYPWLKKTIIGLYIYVSTDSVYEVCQPIQQSPISEKAAIRPNSKKEMETLKKKDSYGHKKLEVEEYLKKESKANGLPYIILRLPDVLGPRDSTDRWWKYQLWMRYASHIPIPVPTHLIGFKTSFVYSMDVARLITGIIAMQSNPLLYNEAYNLGYPNPKSLLEFLTDLKKSLTPPEQDHGDAMTAVTLAKGRDGDYFFPSVTRGWLDVAKAEQKLDWNPTAWTKMVQDTAQFYNNAEQEFKSERNDCLESLLEDFSEFLDKDTYRTIETSFNALMGKQPPKQEL